MLGFDAEERLIQKLPNDFAEKIVWGSRYPHHDTTSAHDAIEALMAARVEEPTIAQNAGRQRRTAIRHRASAKRRCVRTDFSVCNAPFRCDPRCE